MFANVLSRVKQLARIWVQAVRNRISAWAQPTTRALPRSTIVDRTRSKHDLVVENALLRQHRIVLRRSVKRPRLTSTDRTLLVLLTSRVRAWKDAVLIVKPETMLRWHRSGFRLFGKWTSKTQSRESKIPAETMALMKEIAINNRLWGAERIRGELLKLGMPVSKRTIQKYLRQARPPCPAGQSWATVLHNLPGRSGPATLARSPLAASAPAPPASSRSLRRSASCT